MARWLCPSINLGNFTEIHWTMGVFFKRSSTKWLIGGLDSWHPLMKGIVTGGTPRIPDYQPKPPINHHLTWNLIDFSECRKNKRPLVRVAGWHLVIGLTLQPRCDSWDSQTKNGSGKTSWWVKRSDFFCENKVNDRFFWKNPFFYSTVRKMFTPFLWDQCNPTWNFYRPRNFTQIPKSDGLEKVSPLKYGVILGIPC